MMKNPAQASPRGFTLVELLVAIVIIAILSVTALAVARSAKAKAEGAECLSQIRQCGSALLQAAMDDHGRLKLSTDAAGDLTTLPYGVIAGQLDPQVLDGQSNFKVIHCPTAPSPQQRHVNCYGVNFADSEMAGAAWVQEESGLLRLTLSSVRHANRFPLVIDSCISNGSEEFQLSGSTRPGLRHNGKANAFFLDGSTRPLGLDDLGRAGFTEAFDCSERTPKLVNLPQS